MTTFKTRAAALCALLATTSLVALTSTPAAAQSMADQPTPPRDYNLDENGVDLVTGQYHLFLTDVSIGHGDGALTYSRTLRAKGYDDPYETSLNIVVNEHTISIGDTSDTFLGPNSASMYGTGARLEAQPNGTFWYITTDGTSYVFSRSVFSTRFRIAEYRATQIVYPNGRSIWIEYDISSSPSYHLTRPSAVTSSEGYRLTFRYISDSLFGSEEDRFARWMTLASVTASNSAVEYCTSLSCPPSDPRWRSTTYTWSADKLQETRTDSAGRSMVTTIDAAGRITAVKPYGAASNRVALTYHVDGRVATVHVAGGTWKYAYLVLNGVPTTTVTSPTGLVRVVTTDNSKVRTDKIGTAGTTSYEYDNKKRLTKVTAAEGNSVMYGYDARDNVASATLIAKGGAASRVVRAVFPATCQNYIVCNSPTSITDARGYTTEYEYDPVHGGVTRVRRPQIAGQPHRTETRFSYAPLQASYYGPNGIVYQGTTTWRLSGSSQCSAGDAAQCVGTANETKTEISYASPGPRSNLLPTKITIRAGDNSVSASEDSAYNAFGEVVAVDGPLLGTGDTTTYSYDPTGALSETRSPDPDGGGLLGRRAMKIVRDSEERLSELQAGYHLVNADGTEGPFVVSETRKSSYDANTGLKTTDTLLANGAVVQLSQYKHDSAGRLACAAARLNRVEHQDACVDAGGTTGKDIVQQLTYGADGRLAAIQIGEGVAAYTYTPNGNLATLTDGESNRTTYEYDSFDRLWRTRFPAATRRANSSSTTDYEELGYDENGNVTSRRIRDGQVLGFSYDALNRMTREDTPGSTVGEVDLTFSYDDLDRLKSASDHNGRHNSFEYDALGRVKRQYSDVSSNSLQYDAAGRMTRQTWADGFYVDYEYDVTGAMLKIRESGGLELARFEYDAQGRRKTLTRGNRTVTSYRYDQPGAPLTTLFHDLGGSTHDLTLVFDYDGLGRIRSRTSSNNAYAFIGASSNDRSYTPNGLNQYAFIGSIAPSYDRRGNMTNNGQQTYTYNARNELIGNGSGQLFYRNPLGLLADGDGTRSDYVENRLVTEFDGGVARRYVHGPGLDEPLVWYEGAGTGSRRYLHADERGSVIAVTNDAGTAIAVNTYDEYGRPGTANQGRFQYTGQRWIGSLGLYDYKARMYSPELGRFMQADPIGYSGGLNLYAYTRNDPVNFVDPSGLCDNGICPPIEVWGQRFAGGYVTSSDSSSGGGFGSIVYTGLMIRPAPPAASDTRPQSGEPVEEARLGPIIKFVKWMASKLSSKPTWKFGPGKSAQKWQNQMRSRGWTEQQINEAVERGVRLPAPNNINPANGATRYISPSNGQSVVVDNVTREVIHIGGPGFVY